MSIGYQQALNALQKAGAADPETEARWLLHILHGDGQENGRSSNHLQIDWPDFIRQRRAGVPLEYILGRTRFMGLTFTCTPAALIPRPETELLVQSVLDFITQKQITTPNLTLIDMGTGSGNIAVSLAMHTQNTAILASDISPEAIALARQHVIQYELVDRVHLFWGDLFESLHGQGYEGQIDIVVCNPPYLPTGSLAKLAPEIIEHEPVVALDAGAYGINIFRRLVSDALTFLKQEGLLAFEIGAGQDKIARRLLEKTGGYTNITGIEDSEGQVRVIQANKR